VALAPKWDQYFESAFLSSRFSCEPDFSGNRSIKHGRRSSIRPLHGGLQHSRSTYRDGSETTVKDGSSRVVERLRLDHLLPNAARKRHAAATGLAFSPLAGEVPLALLEQRPRWAYLSRYHPESYRAPHAAAKRNAMKVIYKLLLKGGYLKKSLRSIFLKSGTAAQRENGLGRKIIHKSLSSSIGSQHASCFP